MNSATARVASFTYHEVTDQPGSSGFQRPGALRFTLSRRAYLSSLEQIAAGPNSPALVSDLDLALPGRHLALTFDDGGKSALYAAEELSRRGWKGHFFIVTGLTGTRTFLSRAEIRLLHSWGHVIGSHSNSHPNIFREQSRARMLEEWRVSADALSSLLGQPCLTASVPGGDISDEVLETGAEAGFRYLFTIEPQLTPRRVNGCWVLGRYSLRPVTPPARIDELIRFRGWTTALAVRRLKVLARRTLPPVYRQIVARRTRAWDNAG